MDKFENWKPHKGPYFCEFDLQRPDQILTEKIRERSFHVSSVYMYGEWNLDILKYTQSILFFWKNCPQGEIFYQTLTHLEGGKAPSPAYSSLPVSLKEGRRVGIVTKRHLWKLQAQAQAH